jgi:lipoprotein-anchoring transpeptidase ErfK/SrfK
VSNRFRFARFAVRVSRTTGTAGPLFIAVAFVAACGAGMPTSHARRLPPADTGIIAPVPVSAAQMARLPRATTFTTVPAAPPDPSPYQPGNGVVTHPSTARVVYARPGGPPVAVLPPTQLGEPTWVPVVETQPGWERVLLPARPNRSTGWIYLADGGLSEAYSSYRVRIELSARRLTVANAGVARSWTVAVGAPATPTPTGRTFMLASLVPPRPTYSPLVLPLGTHSPDLDTFGGGPGTVALHGWPDASVFGHEISHGCVRVPADALRALSRVPLGSPVLITR